MSKTNADVAGNEPDGNHPGRHNMRYGVLHGAAFHMATAFADPHAVIPLFLAGFTESRALIGLVVSLVGAVGILPQLAMSRQLRRNPRSARPFMLVAIWTRCGAWGLIAAMALLMPVQSVWILIAFVCLISVYSLGGGVAVLPFKQVVSDTISPQRRSSFFGWRLLIGGILAVVAGVIVTQVLGSGIFSWPRNYGVLFALSFITLAAAYIAMSQLRFSYRRLESPPAALPALRQEVADAFRQYPILKRLIAVRLLSGGLPLAFPFLTLYATGELGISLAWVGVYVASRQAGGILSNFGWMPLGNRFGTRSVILSGLALAALGFGVILLSGSPVALAGAFALAGAGMSAMTVGFSGYILELGTPQLRPLLFALEDTLLMPLYFMPLLGGWLVDGFGYLPAILVGGALLLAGFICACALCEPRRGDLACGPCTPAGESEVE
ncbi:MAG: MFS transporter [Phycisphaerae bacterium]